MPNFERVLFGPSDKGMRGNTGYQGPPASPISVGDGWPASENVCMTPTNDQLRATPGSKRTLVVSTSQTTNGTAPYLSIVKCNALQGFEQPGGVGLAINDGISGRTMAQAYCPSAQPVETDPVLIGHMLRQQNWDFPTPLEINDMVFFAKEQDNKVFDGVRLRDWGIRAPALKPTVTAVDSGSTVTTIEQCSTGWAASAGQGSAVTVTNPDTDPPPVDPGDPNFVKGVADDSVVVGDMMFVNQTATIATTVKSIMFWFYFDLTSVSVPLPAGNMAIVFATSTALGGSRITKLIPIDIPPRQWTRVTVPWDETVAFSMQSVGFEIATEFPATFFINSSDTLTFCADQIQTIIPGSGFASGGTYRVAVTWWDAATRRESNGSPPSDAIELQAGQGISIEASGNYAGIPSEGMINLNPQLVSLLTAPYEWIAGANGTSNYYLRNNTAARYPRIYERPVNVYQDTTKLDAGALGGLSAGEWAWGDDDSLGYDTVYVRLTDSTDPDSKPEHTVRANMPGVGAMKVYIAKEQWGAAPDGRLQWRLMSDPYVGSPFDQAASTDYAINFTFSDNVNEDSLLQSPGLSQGNAKPPCCKYAVSDGTRIFMGGQDDYSVGTMTVDTDRVRVTPDNSAIPATTPIIGYWMEGRKIRFEREDELYTVVQAFSSTILGSPNTIRIGRDYRPDVGDYTEGYQGSAVGSKAYVILGAKNLAWYTSKTTDFYTGRGSYLEGIYPSNIVRYEMTGDEISGINHIGDAVVVMGESHVFTIYQDKSIADDQGVGQAFINPRLMHGWPGCISNRGMIPIQNGNLAYISSTGKAILGTPGGFTTFGAQNTVNGEIRRWMTVNNNVDTLYMKYIWGTYDEFHNWVLWFSPTSGG